MFEAGDFAMAAVRDALSVEPDDKAAERIAGAFPGMPDRVGCA